MDKHPDDRPGHLYYTGEEQLNRVTRDCGVKRYSVDPEGHVYENDDGQLVRYHHYCAAIRTKVSSIQHNNQLWDALVVLARHIPDDELKNIVGRFPTLNDIETAMDRSRDQWDFYEREFRRDSST